MCKAYIHVYESERVNIVLTFEKPWSSGGQTLLHCMIIASNSQARLNSAGMCLSCYIYAQHF